MFVVGGPARWPAGCRTLSSIRSSSWSSSSRRCSTAPRSSRTSTTCAGEPAPDLAASIGLVIVTRCVVGRRRAHTHRRTALGGGVRARRDRLPHRPRCRHLDRAAARRAPAAGDDPRGREPHRRRQRAHPLPGRGGRHRRRHLLAFSTPAESSSSSVAGGIAIGLLAGVLIIEDPPRDGRPAGREHDLALLPGTPPTSRRGAGVSGVLAAVTAGIYLGWQAPKIARAPTSDAVDGRLGAARLSSQRGPLPARRAAAAVRSSRASTDTRSASCVGYSAAVSAAVVWHRFLSGLTMPCVVRASTGGRARSPGEHLERRVVERVGRHARRGHPRGRARPAATTDSGAPFPERDLLIFLAYSVVLF